MTLLHCYWLICLQKTWHVPSTCMVYGVWHLLCLPMLHLVFLSGTTSCTLASLLQHLEYHEGSEAVGPEWAG